MLARMNIYGIRGDMGEHVEQCIPDTGHTHTQNSTDVPALWWEYLTSFNPSVKLFMRKDTESLVNINTAASLLLLPQLCSRVLNP